MTSHSDHFPRSHLPFHDLKKKIGWCCSLQKLQQFCKKYMYLCSKFIDLCILNQIVAGKFCQKTFLDVQWRAFKVYLADIVAAAAAVFIFAKQSTRAQLWTKFPIILIECQISLAVVHKLFWKQTLRILSYFAISTQGRKEPQPQRFKSWESEQMQALQNRKWNHSRAHMSTTIIPITVKVLFQCFGYSNFRSI